MEISEIEMMLNLLATNRIGELKNYLINKRNEYYNKKQDEEFTKVAYSTFLKYMCDLNTKSYYSYVQDKTIFNDDVSLFVINKKFEIGINPCDADFSLSTLKKVNEMIEKKKLIDFKYKELNTYILRRGEIAYQFAQQYVDYLTIFFGKDTPIYIDSKNPIAYAESNNGMGFILGRKKRL